MKSFAEEKVLVVMLGHKSLSGKDTVFSFSRDLGFVRAAFADKLKSTVADLYNLTEDQVHGNLKDVPDKKYKNTRDSKTIVERTHYGTITSTPNSDYAEIMTPRRILQLFGQDQRSIYKDIWASYVFDVTIPKLVEEGHRRIVITDFRFKNEASVAFDWKGRNRNNILKIVRVVRPGVISKSGAGDISENDLNNFTAWTHTILNDSSLEDLRKKTIQLFQEFTIEL